MKIIPAIDIIDGQCIRLEKGDFNKKSVYSSDPLEVAKKFEDHGLKNLHLVDLDGAKLKSPQNLGILEVIATNTNLNIDFGGGISSPVNVDQALNSGAQKVNIGSMAISYPEQFTEILVKWGGEKIVLAADIIKHNIAINAWQKTSDSDIFETISSFTPDGLQYAACTDISKDGMLSGPAIELYKQLCLQTDIKIIASGGVTNTMDLDLLIETGVYGAIIGKAIYEGTLTMKQLSDYA